MHLYKICYQHDEDRGTSQRYSQTLHILILGYKKVKIDRFNEDLNPGLALITDWIISSGNTALSVDMMQSCLEQMARDDIIEIIQKGQGE